MKRTIVLLFLLLAAVLSLGAVEVAGVTMPSTVNIKGKQLLLNGAGVRKKLGMNIYAQALYLSEKSSDGQSIINADEPMMIRLAVVSGIITTKMFVDTTIEAYDESTNGNPAPIQKEIDAFMQAFASGVNKGDVYDIVYTPGVGIEVFKNGATISPVCVKGMAIKKATFGIWIGPRKEKALQNLRLDLLGLR